MVIIFNSSPSKTQNSPSDHEVLPPFEQKPFMDSEDIGCARKLSVYEHSHAKCLPNGSNFVCVVFMKQDLKIEQDPVIDCGDIGTLAL